MPTPLEYLPIPHSPAGETLALLGTTAVGATIWSARTRILHHAQKSAERQNHGIISPVIYVPVGHRGIAERLHNPVYAKDGKPKILMPGRNWIPFNSAVIVSTQRRQHTIIHHSIEHEDNKIGQIYSKAVVGWHVGEEPKQLFDSHYNFVNAKSVMMDTLGGKVEVTPLELAAVGIIASGLRHVLKKSQDPFAVDDDTIQAALIEKCAEKLNTVCGSEINDLSIPDIGRSQGQMGVEAFREIGGVTIKLPESLWAGVPGPRQALERAENTA